MPRVSASGTSEGGGSPVHPCNADLEEFSELRAQCRAVFRSHIQVVLLALPPLCWLSVLFVEGALLERKWG